MSFEKLYKRIELTKVCIKKYVLIEQLLSFDITYENIPEMMDRVFRIRMLELEEYKIISQPIHKFKPGSIGHGIQSVRDNKIIFPCQNYAVNMGNIKCT